MNNPTETENEQIDVKQERDVNLKLGTQKTKQPNT